jgi:hypothetical protein
MKEKGIVIIGHPDEALTAAAYASLSKLAEEIIIINEPLPKPEPILMPRQVKIPLMGIKSGREKRRERRKQNREKN